MAKLWRYNLHYFDDLTADDAAGRRGWHTRLMDRWTAENPPTRGTGWEPYPLSLRVVNWIKWVLAGNLLSPAQNLSLAIQVRHLARRLEWHLLGNHLLANAKALVFAGLYFGGAEARGWLGKGLAILAAQLPEQVLADGGHYERSPMYHALLLEDLLDLVNLHRAYAEIAPAGWVETAGRMKVWLAVMTHPDGGIAFFNDAALDIAPPLAELASYADRLGMPGGNAPPSSVHLPDSGYARLQEGAAVVLADVAPVGPDFLPGHAHADTLSFEVSLHGRRLLVNSGTSVYGLSEERQRQRGSAAHNTLRVDGQDSSEVWSGFRVARRARPFDVEWADAGIRACHDGYRRLSGKPVHCRSWQLTGGCLEVTDEVLGGGRHRVELFFHVHPGWQVEADGGDGMRLTDSDSGSGVYLQLDRQMRWRLAPATWHPRFGVAMENRCIVGEWDGPLPLRVSTRMEWPCAS